MLAAEAIFPLLDDLGDRQPESGKQADEYEKLFQNSWLYQELHQARNIRPAFKWGLIPAMIYSGLELYLFKGRAPWTIKHHGTDHGSLKKAAACQPIDYPKPDGKITV